MTPVEPPRVSPPQLPPLIALDPGDACDDESFSEALLTWSGEQASLIGADITWQELRNRSAVALHLGSGLTPGDVRMLRVTSPVVRTGDEKGVPGTVHVPAHGDSPEREAPVIKWAGRVLAYWLQVRKEQKLAGDFLFPATRTGKPWGKVTHYDAVKAVLEASGIDKSLVEGGAYRLRHTFALRQLRRGKSPDLVAKWLGVVEMRVMDRYRRVDGRWLIAGRELTMVSFFPIRVRRSASASDLPSDTEKKRPSVVRSSSGTCRTASARRVNEASASRSTASSGTFRCCSWSQSLMRSTSSSLASSMSLGHACAGVPCGPAAMRAMVPATSSASSAPTEPASPRSCASWPVSGVLTQAP